MQNAAHRLFLLSACAAAALALRCGPFAPYDVGEGGEKSSELGVLRLYMSDEAEAFFRTTPQVRENRDIVYLTNIVASFNGRSDTLVNAEVNLHGEHGVQFARKSLEIDLGSKHRLFNHPDVVEEFFILALEEDSGYVHYYMGASFLQAAGLWHNHFEYIEVYLNDTYEGLYLFTEKTQNSARKAYNNVASVLRRDYNWGFYEKYCNERYAAYCPQLHRAARHTYELTDLYTGALLRDSLMAIMRLDNYCRWLALNTLLQNGDYLDEVFFIALALPGDTSFVFDIAGWDYEELFVPPHDNLKIDNSLVYCGQDSLDATIARDSVLYAFFEDNFRSLMTEVVTDALIDSIQQEIERIVLPQFQRAMVVKLMDNFSSSPGAAYQEMRDLITNRFWRLRRRKEYVLSALGQ